MAEGGITYKKVKYVFASMDPHEPPRIRMQLQEKRKQLATLLSPPHTHLAPKYCNLLFIEQQYSETDIGHTLFLSQDEC